MRSILASAVLGLSLIAGCNVGDTGGGGGGGDTPDAAPGEQPDAPVQETPKLDVTIDKPTVSTELMTKNMVTVTLTGSGGFSGDVTLAASALSAAGQVIPGWTATLNIPSVTVPLNGTATAVATLTIPSENKGLSGELDIVATSSLGAQTVKSTVAVANQVTSHLTLTNASCVYPATKTFSVSVGTKVRVQNDSTDNIIFHMGPNSPSIGVGLNHQNNNGTAPGAAYEQIVTAPPAGTPAGGIIVPWYCHNRNDPTNLKITVVVP